VGRQLRKLSMNALESLENYNPSLYPNTRKLLTILATIPGTTALADRSFSTLNNKTTENVPGITYVK